MDISGYASSRNKTPRKTDSISEQEQKLIDVSMKMNKRIKNPLKRAYHNSGNLIWLLHSLKKGIGTGETTLK
jgi:hypothetical protein